MNIDLKNKVQRKNLGRLEEIHAFHVVLSIKGGAQVSWICFSVPLNAGLNSTAKRGAVRQHKIVGRSFLWWSYKTEDKFGDS